MKLLESKGAGFVSYYLKKNSAKKNWQLRWKPVCASTELDLSNWLNKKPMLEVKPRAYLAARQSHGRGQYGRTWNSPSGGVWLSAAMQLEHSKDSTSLFGLAVAVALAKTLQRSSIPVKIKWPNDLLVFQKKLAGVLPRVVIRGGNIKLARVGIGLNVYNRVSNQAISLDKISAPRSNSTAFWAAEVLMALENSLLLMKNKHELCKEAKNFLWADQITEEKTGKVWKIEGFNYDGSLKVRRGILTNSFSRWS